MSPAVEMLKKQAHGPRDSIVGAWWNGYVKYRDARRYGDSLAINRLNINCPYVRESKFAKAWLDGLMLAQQEHLAEINAFQKLRRK